MEKTKRAKELYKENERLKEAMEKFIEEESLHYEAPDINILKEALYGK